MAVFRSDQAQVTFMSEPAAGGYVEMATAVTAGTGTARINLAAGYPAGTRQMAIDSISGSGAHVVVGDVIQIGTAATLEQEIRRIEHIAKTSPTAVAGTITLDAPTAFRHRDNTDIAVITATTETTDDQYITMIPGAYETVDVPDPEFGIEGRWFLGTQSKRGFYAAYSGQQTYAGSIGGFALLNGRALRYPIGTVATETANVTAAIKCVIAEPAVDGDPAGAKKGDILVKVSGITQTTIPLNQALVFGTGTELKEVRRHVGTAITGATGTLKLDYPLQFDHADATDVLKVVTVAGGSTLATTATVVPYTHTISEAIDLESVSWHVHMLASNEDYDYTFDRRYYGGKIGSMTLSGEEGGMVTGSWDSVNFLGFIHNQKTTSAATHNGGMPFYSVMQTIKGAEGGDGKVVFPTTEPYYFSQGEVTMFGQTIARIRSFSLSITNNEEPRYYITKQMGRRRGPTEIREQRREYSLAVTLALPDAGIANASQRTLFQEMLLEGNYGTLSDFMRTGKKGFDVTITFTRGDIVHGTEDKITITIPSSTATTGGNSQGAFIRTAPHNITDDNPFQVEADILFRNLSIVVQDAEHYYP